MDSRTYNTLFMIESLDGKISSGTSDDLDADRDWPQIEGVKEGLHQYYDLEQKTDLVSLNTGRVMAKIGANNHKDKPEKSPVSFVIIDNKPHLNEDGVRYLAEKSKTFYLITANLDHPAIKSKVGNLEIIKYDSEIDFGDLFKKLKQDFGIERVTIQSGGTLNATLIREGLIDEVSVVVAPLFVGGKDTPTLVDGESLGSRSELNKIKALKLLEAKTLEKSYLHLRYKVINK